MRRNEIRKIRKGIDLINLLLKKLQSEKRLGVVFELRNSFYHVFFNDNRLDEIFLLLFPVEEIEKISTILHVLRTACSTSGDTVLMSSQGIDVKRDDLVEWLNRINWHLNRALTNNSGKIFYSWQSDSDNSVNRNFIQSAVEKAILNVGKVTSLPLALDKDTKDRAGSPDIASTILEKINECFIFIADISLVIHDEKTHKNSPNPNVLFELGYAQGILSEENIIMVFNSAYGKISDLPFDLRGKRIMQYFCPPSISQEKKMECKKELIRNLQSAIELRCKTENGIQ